VREFFNLSKEQMKWGQNAFFPAGHHINPYSHLMTRADPKQLDALFDAGMDAATPKSTPAASAAPPAASSPAAAAPAAAAVHPRPPPRISIDDFLRIDLRVAKVLDAQLITGADKLLKLHLDVGDLGERQIFAGIRSAYDPASARRPAHRRGRESRAAQDALRHLGGHDARRRSGRRGHLRIVSRYGRRARHAGEVSAVSVVAERIDALLPQTQCTRCGYAGCRPYAAAIAAGEAQINQCPPGGRATIEALARLLGPRISAAESGERGRVAAARGLDRRGALHRVRALLAALPRRCHRRRVEVSAHRHRRALHGLRAVPGALSRRLHRDALRRPRPPPDQAALNRERFEAHEERRERRARERREQLEAIKAAAPRVAAPSS
jgi:hypothetical protein